MPDVLEVDSLSPDARALVLLCTSLGAERRGADARPIGPVAWSRLEDSLRRQSFSGPGYLLGLRSEDIARSLDIETMDWTAIEANAPVASLYLPAVADVSTVAPGLEPVAWPRSFADLRGLTTVSRGMVLADRLCGLSHEYVGMMQRQLARFFTWRDLARHELVEALIGRRIVDAIPLNAKGDRLRVALTAENGSSVTVEIRAA